MYMSRLLLIDSRANDTKLVIDSLLPNVDFILVDFFNDTFDTLIQKIGSKTYDSIGVFQENYELPRYQFLNAFRRSVLVNVKAKDPQLNTWREFIDLLTYFRNNLDCKVIDLMGCGIYSSEDWKYVLNKLSGNLGITLNSSVDSTGFQSLGGNWVLESNNENLIGTYFNENIKNYKFILGSNVHSLFLTNTGEVYACGNNGLGQLGNGTNTNSNIPVKVKLNSTTNLSGITAVSQGNVHSLFLTNTGEVYACGYNELGQLGNGTNTDSNYPVKVKLNSTTNLSGITAISCGGYHSLFLTNTGEVYACGNNELGQLGNGTNTNSNYPVKVKLNSTTNLSGITAISCGGYHSLFLTNTGEVYACGNNELGQLGNGTNTNSNYPVKVKLNSTTNLSGITAISCGFYYSLFLRNNNHVYSCGKGSYGRLGYGGNSNQSYPVIVSLPVDVYIVSAGDKITIITISYLRNNGMLANDPVLYSCTLYEKILAGYTLSELFDAGYTKHDFASVGIFFNNPLNFCGNCSDC